MGVGKFLLGAAAVVGGGALCFVTGGLAAPAIGAAVGSAMGLSGAAATSAGLAAIGGGSLAAGGLGMAGGTAVVSGVAAGLGAAATGALIKVICITVAYIENQIKKKKEAAIDAGKRQFSNLISNGLENKNYGTSNALGLNRDEAKVTGVNRYEGKVTVVYGATGETETYEGRIDDNIREGMKITA